MKLKGNGVINHVLHLAEKRRISYVNEASSRLQLAGTQSGVLSSVPPWNIPSFQSVEGRE